jgi:hypothetical protein
MPISLKLLKPLEDFFLCSVTLSYMNIVNFIRQLEKAYYINS